MSVLIIRSSISHSRIFYISISLPSIIPMNKSPLLGLSTFSPIVRINRCETIVHYGLATKLNMALVISIYRPITQGTSSYTIKIILVIYLYSYTSHLSLYALYSLCAFSPYSDESLRVSGDIKLYSVEKSRYFLSGDVYLNTLNHL